MITRLAEEKEKEEEYNHNILKGVISRQTTEGLNGEKRQFMLTRHSGGRVNSSGKKIDE